MVSTAIYEIGSSEEKTNLVQPIRERVLKYIG